MTRPYKDPPLGDNPWPEVVVMPEEMWAIAPEGYCLVVNDVESGQHALVRKGDVVSVRGQPWAEPQPVRFQDPEPALTGSPSPASFAPMTAKFNVPVHAPHGVPTAHVLDGETTLARRGPGPEGYRTPEQLSPQAIPLMDAIRQEGPWYVPARDVGVAGDNWMLVVPRALMGEELVRLPSDLVTNLRAIAAEQYDDNLAEMLDAMVVKRFDRWARGRTREPLKRKAPLMPEQLQILDLKRRHRALVRRVEALSATVEEMFATKRRTTRQYRDRS